MLIQELLVLGADLQVVAVDINTFLLIVFLPLAQEDEMTEPP